MVTWSVDAARTVADHVVVVVPAGHHPRADSGSAGAGACFGADLVVEGGATRSASVRAGLAGVPGDASVIVVHDAARPLAPPTLFTAVVDAVVSGQCGGAIPVLAVTDTLKRVVEGVVGSTVDRDGLMTVQTPQAFDAVTLRAAHAAGSDATDDAALVEALGVVVRAVPGDPRNVKLTHPGDLVVVEAMLGSVRP